MGHGPLASRTAVGPSVAPHRPTVAFHPPALDGDQPVWTRPSARAGGEGQTTQVALQGTGDWPLSLISTPHRAPCTTNQAGRRRRCPVSPCSFCRTWTTHSHTCSDPCTHALPRPWGRSADIPVSVTGHTRHPLPKGPQLLHIRAVRHKGGPGLPCSACISATLRGSVCHPGT